MIRLYFETLDGIRKTKTFKTLKGARKAAWDWVGKDADIGRWYAVSFDGVVKVMADGCTLAELFSDKPVPKPGEEFWNVVSWHSTEKDWGTFTINTKPYATEAEAIAAMNDLAEDGYWNLGIEGWRYDHNGDPVPIEKPKPAPSPAPDDSEIPF